MPVNDKRLAVAVLWRLVGYLLGKLAQGVEMLGATFAVNARVALHERAGLPVLSCITGFHVLRPKLAPLLRDNQVVD